MTEGLSRELMALRVSRELLPGEVVNLGIGLPTLVSQFLDHSLNIMLHAENGILGYGRHSEDDIEDVDFINASGDYVSIYPGASFFDSAQSFAMVRGGHIDVSVLGGLQVSAKGDLANWYVPERGGGSIGGAMDLAVGARKLVIAMEHTTRDGRSRILDECTYPITGVACVDLIITNLAVIEVRREGLVLTETAPGVALEDVLSATETKLTVSEHLREMF